MLLERHGDAVRADFIRHGRSLGELFSGELTPDECWDFITHLPRDSATQAAIYADPEFAVDDDGPGPEPTLAEFSPEVEAIAAVHDVLAAILANLSSLTSKRPVKLNPYRRPGEARRAQAKARRDEQARQQWNGILAQLGVEGGQHG